MYFIAHVKRVSDESWAFPHLLTDHLEGTANLAEDFAKKFASEDWGRIAGLAHDAGKGRVVWQEYLRTKSGFDEEAHLEGQSGRIPHAIYGAKILEDIFGTAIGRFVGYCVAGHHAGLPDWSSGSGSGQAALEFQLSRIEDHEEVADFVWEGLRTLFKPIPPWRFSNGLDLSLWIRMLFSCLVDADFLDTEKYVDPNIAFLRKGYSTVTELLERLELHNEHLVAKSPRTEVNRIRQEVRNKCMEMAREPQGIFSLTVPTGGGKTLSSLAFALEHAKKHGLDRVVYVIPYTSIIEQNADVLRNALGTDQVVEHHFGIDDDNLTSRTRLASENWDAPIIVTTSVQFFESLFASRPSKCRKLHNIVGSVVVLDEAQLLPIEFLAPVLETMQLLVDRYRVSFVISTATQPALGERVIGGGLSKGLRDMKEIMGTPKEVEKLFESLKRVEVEIPEDLHTPISWEELSSDLKDYQQVLCVVSDRKSCRELHSLMPEGTYHLSALMCGQHRSEVIEEIKEKLKIGELVRVISTQLVEAGVDFDFPVVYRALAGLDSIAQAAGRCNREGRLPNKGKVVVFIPPKSAPIGLLRKAAETTKSLLTVDSTEPLEPAKFESYFTELYWKANSLDSKGIVDLLSPKQPDYGVSFRTAASAFEIIDGSKQRGIFVPYGEGETLIDELRFQGPSRVLMRKLQRYVVNIYNDDFYKLLQRGSIEEVHPSVYALSSSLEYDKTVGLITEQKLFKPEELIF